MRSSVDLPEPDWPITPRSWPAGTTSDTWSTARLPPKLLTTPSNRSIEPLDGSPDWAVPVGCCGKATLWLQNQDALWGIGGALIRPALGYRGRHVVHPRRQDTLALEGARSRRIAGGAGFLERTVEREAVHADAARLHRPPHRGLALLGVATLGHVEQAVGSRTQAAHMQDQKVSRAGRHLVDRPFGRDAGVQEDDAFDAMTAQIAQEFGKQGLERVGREMLAAGKRSEGRIEAEADDRGSDHGKPLDQLLRERTGDERIGLERQGRAVRLRRRPHRAHAPHARLRTGPPFSP